jgi:hypothetical protein
MSKNLQKLIIIMFIGLFVTGLAATIAEYRFVIVTKEVMRNIIRIHSSWTVLTGVVVGMVLEGHVRKQWKKIDNKKKIFGIALLCLLSVLLLTSFVLRHIKLPDVSQVAKLVHTIAGFLLMLAFCLHKFIKNKS